MNRDVKNFRNRNPFENIDWNSWHRVMGCTHLHCTSDEELQGLFAGGLEFVTLSNYHPSAPWYPLREMKTDQFKLHQKGFVRDGKYFDEEINWKDVLPEESSRQLPADDGDAAFSHIPGNIMEAPNAEHSNFSDTTPQLHITAPGTTFTSGHFDDRADKFGLIGNGFSAGCNLPWREAFRRVLDTLVIPDGGGIIINHPAWSYLRQDFLCEMLDSHPEVLGLEVYNGTSRKTYTDFSDPLWDAVLASGRQ